MTWHKWLTMKGQCKVIEVQFGCISVTGSYRDIAIVVNNHWKEVIYGVLFDTKILHHM